MLSFQKSASNWTGLGYDFSSSSIAYPSTTVFISPTNIVEFENNDVKNVLASEHPLSLIRKKLRTLGLIEETLNSLNKRSNIYVITVEQLDILNLITISG